MFFLVLCVSVFLATLSQKEGKREEKISVMEEGKTVPTSVTERKGNKGSVAELEAGNNASRVYSGSNKNVLEVCGSLKAQRRRFMMG